ncbi:MAG: hypothetical protein LBP82_00835 [Candidatus Methanoplasma sp.]|jgi:hypothetical protein|nr:hypothetical protein [Candidatus Methanoplasma sp.]
MGEEKYIRFMTDVNSESADKLIRIVDNVMRDGCSKKHLLIPSIEGSVFHAFFVKSF